MVADKSDSLKLPGRFLADRSQTVRIAAADAVFDMGRRTGQKKAAQEVLTVVDGGWRQTTQVCAVDVVGTRLAKIEIPDLFVAAIPHKTMYPTLVDGRFQADMGLDSVGFVGDVMPATLADATDWDKDGHPGATVHAKVAVLGGGEVYVAQAAWLLLDGQVKDGAVDGQLIVRRFDQRTYGGDPEWLGMDTRLTADEKKSSFRMVPVAPTASCAEVVAATLGGS